MTDLTSGEICRPARRPAGHDGGERAAAIVVAAIGVAATRPV